ncbi:MAG TPA: amidohydrolase family protein [Solirubrobacteraceae bacterium]|jgi:imidazolonepropionase-like amidohydrolase
MPGDAWTIDAVPVLGGARERWAIADGLLVREPPPGAQPLPGGWVAPGLVDAHVHLTFETHERLGLPRGSPELIAAHLDLHRRAGVLAVRDAGALPGVALDPEPPGGGRVISCGPFLVPPDSFLAHLVEPTPAEQAVARARAMVRAGQPWVKLIADAPGPGHDPLAPVLGYPFALLAEISAAVHEEGGRLAAHVMGRTVAEVLAAGVDSIEHANWATREDVETMAARGTAWTPTLTTVAHYLEPIADRVPPAAELLARQRETLPYAVELGVPILAGTDEGAHGSVADEVAALVRYGAPPAAAVAAASTAARAFLGLPGLEEAAPADVVTFDADPVADPRVLARPAAVVCGGRRIV